MKLSEAIELLEEMQREHGDIEIVSWDTAYCEMTDFKPRYDEDKNYVYA